jgi:EpsI family protein
MSSRTAPSPADRIGAVTGWGLFWLIAATGAAGWFFADGLDALLTAWSLPEYSHGPLIPILSGLLFLRQLKEFPPDPGPKRDRWIGVTVIFAAIAIGAAGKLANISDIVAYATILWVGGLLLVSFGWKTGRHFWPPVLHLVFMLPLPGVLYFKLNTWLQLISSELGVFFLQLANVPVFLEGNIIDLGILRLHVAEACSGLRYLFPIMSFSYVFATLYRGPVWHKAVLLALGRPDHGADEFRAHRDGRCDRAGIRDRLAGWIHPFLRGLGDFHHLRGAAVPVGLGDAQAAAQAHDPVPGAGPGDRRPGDAGRTHPPGAALGGADHLRRPSAGRHRRIPGPARAWRSGHRPRPVLPVPARPGRLAAGTGPRQILDANIVDGLNSDDYHSDHPDTRGRTNRRSVFSWRGMPTRRRAAFTRPRSACPGAGWEIAWLERSDIADRMGTDTPFNINRAIIQQNDTRMMVYYWFQQGDRRIAWDFAAKFYLLIDGVTSGSTDGALIRLTTLIGRDEEDAVAEARLQSVLDGLMPVLPRFVPDS